MDRNVRFSIFLVVFLILAQLYCNMFVIKKDEIDFVKNVASPYVNCKIARNILEQAMSLSYSMDNGFGYENMDMFINSVLKSLAYKEVKNLKDSDEYKYIALKPKEISKFNLSLYNDKPIIVLINRMSLMFYKFDAGCKNVDTNNVEKSSCVIDVDINMYNSLPNTKKYDNNCPGKTDRYSLIIDGEHNSVVIPKKYDKKLFY